MSTEVAVAAPKPLTIQERALVAIGGRNEVALQALADGTKDITTITNDDGYKQVHAARIVLKNERIAIEKDCKKARKEATAFGKAVIAEEGRLVGILSPEEKRLQKLQEVWDAEIERKRQEKVDAEIKRVADLQARVTKYRGNQAMTPSSGSAAIAEEIEDIEALVVDDSFQEFQQQAMDAKAGGLARLRAIHTAAVAHEAEQEQLRIDREELAQHRAAQAKKDAEAKVISDAAEARQREELELAQSRLSEIQGIQQQVVIAQLGRAGVRKGRTIECIRETLAETEAWRIEESNFGPLTKAAQTAKDTSVQAIRDLLTAAETKAADEARIATQRADLARQQEELRKSQEPRKPVAQPVAPVTRFGVAVSIPPASEIISVLAKHYRAQPDTIIDWLQQTDFSQVKAA